MNGIGIASCFGFFGLIVFIEAVIQWFDSRSSGWQRLARRYPAAGAVARQPLHGRMWMNGKCYASSSTVAVAGAGIRLAMESPFGRLFHPPVFIPWDDLSAVDEGGDETLPLHVGESATIMLTGPAAATVSQLLVPRKRSRRSHVSRHH